MDVALNNDHIANLVSKLIRKRRFRQTLKDCTTFDTSKEETKFLLLRYVPGFVNDL